MRMFRRAGTVALVLSVFLVALVFVLENQQTSSLIFLGMPTPYLPVSLYVAISFLVGMVIGPLTMLIIRGLFAAKKRAR
ncbi:DUF1049 domain-containing protein [Pseudomonas umsongensis]